MVAQDNKGVKRLHNGPAMIIGIVFWSNYLKRDQQSQLKYFRISTVSEGWNHRTDSGTAVGKLIGEDNQGLPFRLLHESIVCEMFAKLELGCRKPAFVGFAGNTPWKSTNLGFLLCP